jgi:hypothetical protein
MFSKSLLCFSMLLIFYLATWSFANIRLFSLFLACNFALSFCSFSFIIYLFFISRSKSLSKIFVIYTLYFLANWNILATLLCSSNFVYIPCLDLGVWNLGVWPLKLVPEKPRLFRLFSLFLAYNFALSFCSFSSIIYLFFISKSKSLSKIFVIYTLYFLANWNILATLLCSSNFASIPCLDLGVWNLGVWPLKLVPERPRLLCAV